MKSLLLGFAAALTLVVAPAPSAFARSAHGQHLEGTVQKVDRPAHQLELRGREDGRTVQFTWDAHTTFTVGTRVADDSILALGAKVAVVYHNPLFGRSFLTKVRLVAPN